MGTLTRLVLIAAVAAPFAAAGATAQPPQYIVVCADEVEGRDNPDPEESGYPYFKRGAVEPDAGDAVVAVGGRYWRRIGDDRYRGDKTHWVEDRYLLPLEVYDTLRAADEMMRANDAGAAEKLRAAAVALTENEDSITFSPDGRKAVLFLCCSDAEEASYVLNVGRYGLGRLLYFEAGRGLADISYFEIPPAKDTWTPDSRRWVLIGRVEFIGDYYGDGLDVYDTAAGEWKWLGPCTGAEHYELEFVGPYVVWLGAEEMRLDVGGYSEPSLILMPALYAYRFDTGEKIKLLASDPATLAREPSGHYACAGDVYFPVTLKAAGEPPPELRESSIYRKLNGAVAQAIVNEA